MVSGEARTRGVVKRVLHVILKQRCGGLNEYGRNEKSASKFTWPTNHPLVISYPHHHSKSSLTTPSFFCQGPTSANRFNPNPCNSTLRPQPNPTFLDLAGSSCQLNTPSSVTFLLHTLLSNLSTCIPTTLLRVRPIIFSGRPVRPRSCHHGIGAQRRHATAASGRCNFIRVHRRHLRQNRHPRTPKYRLGWTSS